MRIWDSGHIRGREVGGRQGRRPLRRRSGSAAATRCFAPAARTGSSIAWTRPSRASRCPSGSGPMLASPGRMPSEGRAGAFEVGWPGERAIALCDTGHLDPARTPAARTCARCFRELFAIALELAGKPVALDGGCVSADGRPSGRLTAPASPSDSEIRRLRTRHAGDPDRLRPPPRRSARACSSSRTSERRERLEATRRSTATGRQTPAYHRGDGNALREAAAARGPRRGGRASASTRSTGRESAAATGARSRSDVAEGLLEEGLVDADRRARSTSPR